MAAHSSGADKARSPGRRAGVRPRRGPVRVSAAVLVRFPRRPRPLSAAPLGKAVADGLRCLGGHRLWRTLAPPLAIDLFCFHLANVTRVLLARRNGT